jgi:hypothetical protein
VIAAALRTFIIGVPVAMGYLATSICLQLLKAQIATSRWWLLPAAAVSVVVCVGVERLTRRLLPLAALLKLSMLFPDRAPSRFKVARRALSVSSLSEQAGTARTKDAGASAEHALALITALTAHDRRTRGHSERVRLFTELLGEQLRLPRDARDKLRWASLLHDIGKLEVAVQILNKPAKLNASEWEVVAAHPVAGEQLLGPLVNWLGEWGGAVRQHHEKFDGTGYPDGAAGVDICRAARIVSIADSYEVMTAHRAYKKPMATVAARAELTRCAGTQFDPALVRAFLAISLPRLLWAMGPASLLMNLPLLRALADTANKGVLATSQGGVLAAGTVAVMSGVVGATTAHPPSHSAPDLASSARPGAISQSVPSAARPGPTPPQHRGSQPVVLPVVLPTAHPAAHVPTLPALALQPLPVAGGATPVTPQPAPALPSPTQPTVPPAAPEVNFRWVPFSLIATSTASVGYAADASAARVLCSLDGAPATECTGTSAAYSGLGDGRHSITVWAEDGAGHRGVSISTSFTVDTEGSSVNWTQVPPPELTSSTTSLGFSQVDPSAETWCSVDGAAASVCSSPLTLTGLADGPHAVSVHTVDAAGNVGAAVQTTFTVDTTAPSVAITSAPGPTITGTSAAVGFTVDDPNATAYCALDGQPAAPCSNPVIFTGLAQGAHTVAIHAVDTFGNVGPAVSAGFSVDSVAPTVTSISVPSAPVASRSVSIPFSVDDPGATAFCSFDAGPASSCTSPVRSADLPDGLHTLSIYAVDAAGNRGATAQADFTISATAPTVTLIAPPRLVANSSVSVAFSVDDPQATAWCALDQASPAVCTSPVNFSNLSDGNHTVDIFAVSQGGAAGATARASFTVDTQAPVVSISSAPSARTTSAQARLAYTVDDPSASVLCSVDGGPAAACASPLDLGNLAEGSHTVTLQAIDPSGNAGPITRASFTVDNTAPAVTLTATPPANSANRRASVSFTTDDPSASTWCRLDANPAQSCSGGIATFSGVSSGSHTISVYAVDAAGNRGASASTSFTVTTGGPTLRTTPPANTSSKIVTFTWQPVLGLRYQYSYDGVSWWPTTTLTSTSSVLKSGTYTFHLRGIDAQGTTTSETTYTFKVK